MVMLPLECTRVLRCLVDAYPTAAPRQALADATGRGICHETPLTRRIDMAASRLRRALKQAGMSRLLVCAVRGVGYRLEVLAPASERRTDLTSVR